jgi:hypothetical protein
VAVGEGGESQKEVISGEEEVNGEELRLMTKARNPVTSNQ